MSESPHPAASRTRAPSVVVAIVALLVVWFVSSRSDGAPAPRPHGAPSAARAPIAAPSWESDAEPAPPPREAVAASPDPARAPTPGSLLIRTVDAASGAPITAVGIALELEDGSASALAPRLGVTDPRGEARFDALPPCPVHLRTDRGVDADGTIEPATQTTLVIAIAAGVDVELLVGAAAPTLQPGRVAASAAMGPETGASSRDATMRRSEGPSKQSGRGLLVGAAATTLQPGRVAASTAMGVPNPQLDRCPDAIAAATIVTLPMSRTRSLARTVLRWIPLYRELLQVRDELGRLRIELDRLRTILAVGWQERLLEEDPRYAEPLRLPRFGVQVSSQNGEDGVLREIFRRIGTTDRVFVELGVGDGTENNTAFLLSQGWTGFWLDGDRRFLRTLEGRRDLDQSLRHRVAFVDRENIAELLRELGVPPAFDLLSLDVDQNTYWVWDGLRGFRPRVVVVEYNAALPADLDWKVRYDPSRTWDGTQNFGASLKALELLGTELGYCLVGCELTGCNAFFVRSDLVADRFARPFTAENHYEPLRQCGQHRRGHPSAILDRP